MYAFEPQSKLLAISKTPPAFYLFVRVLTHSHDHETAHS